jgi:hypothetical protein
MGKKVTEAVICLKTDWISAWISASVLSSDASLALEVISMCSKWLTLLAHSGTEFSWSAVFLEDFALALFP